MVDGTQLWGPVGIPDSDIDGKGLQYYSSREGSPAYGNLYVSGYGGQVIAYSMLNGTTLWTFNSINSGVDSPSIQSECGASAGMVFVCK
jgi:outer membrane protein assembly factor BamB